MFSERIKSLLTPNKKEKIQDKKHKSFFLNNDFYTTIKNDLIPQWKIEKKESLKIWICSSFSGEEVYSIAMFLEYHLSKDQRFKILATGEDLKSIELAKNGVYSKNSLQSIPKEYHSSFITEGKGSVKNWFKISDSLLSKIQFMHFDLTANFYPGPEIFDLVIYPTNSFYSQNIFEEKICDKIFISLKKGGFLLSDKSLNLENDHDYYQKINRKTYCKRVTE